MIYCNYILVFICAHVFVCVLTSCVSMGFVIGISLQFAHEKTNKTSKCFIEV